MFSIITLLPVKVNLLNIIFNFHRKNKDIESIIIDNDIILQCLIKVKISS